jgi:hypothetical protein
MSAAEHSYENELRQLADNLVSTSRKRADLKLAHVPSPQSPNPLCRVQEYLVQLKLCTELMTDWLKECKELVFIVSVISFFVWGVIDALIKTHR